MPEHVHLFVFAPPTIASNTIAKTIKSILAVAVFREFPTLKKQCFGAAAFGQTVAITALLALSLRKPSNATSKTKK